MRKITLGLLFGIFILASLINIVSAMPPVEGFTCNNSYYSFRSEVAGLQINPDITLEKMIQLCTQESCVLDKPNKGNIIIKSHYDERVALIFGQRPYGDDAPSRFYMEVRLPYQLDSQSCSISDGINPNDYNWKESIKTDLSNLKELGVLDISNEEINSISLLASQNNVTINFDNTWMNVGFGCTPTKITNENNPLYGQNSQVCPAYEAGTGVTSEEFLQLPQKSFGSTQSVSSNSIYWIIGSVGIIAVIILVLVLMRKKK